MKANHFLICGSWGEVVPQKQFKIWFEAVREGGQISFCASVDELELCDLGQMTAYYEYDRISIKTLITGRRKSQYLSMFANSENITKLARKVTSSKMLQNCSILWEVVHRVMESCLESTTLVSCQVYAQGKSVLQLGRSIRALTSGWRPSCNTLDGCACLLDVVKKSGTRTDGRMDKLTKGILGVGLFSFFMHFIETSSDYANCYIYTVLRLKCPYFSLSIETLSTLLVTLEIIYF